MYFAGPIGLTFFVDDIGLKKFEMKKMHYNFFPRATPGPSASVL